MSRALEHPDVLSLELSDTWQKTFKKLPLPLQRLVKSNLHLLKEAHRGGQLDIKNIQTIADFGAGIGGPTFALTAITNDVEAFEMHKIFADTMVENGILPAEKVHVGEGISNLEARTDKEYDLVTSFMHGPDPSGELFLKLAKVCKTRLSADGNLLLTFANRNELQTLNSVLGILQKAKANYHLISGLSVDGEEVPPAVIIKKSEIDNL